MPFSGERLANQRRAAGLTQTGLAEVLGIPQPRVSDWERGAVQPRAVMIPIIAAAVGLDALDFLGTDPAAPSLEDLRLAAGLSREGLATAARISLRRYIRLEVGAKQREAAHDLVERLATVLAVPAVTVRAAIHGPPT